MSKSLTKSVLTGFLSVLIVCGIGTAMAAESLSSQVHAALAKKDIAPIRKLLSTGPGNVDEVLKTLLKKAQETIGNDPALTSQMMAVAGEYAPQITPPSVPEVCADMRRVAGALTPEQIGTDLFKSVMNAAEKFSKAPVVVAAGRPNECEQAILDQEALLAQVPGMRGPGLPPTTVRPGDKTSAD